MFVNKLTGAIVTQLELVQSLANTSLPFPITPESLEDTDYAIVESTTAPNTGRFETLVQGNPVQEDGVWKQNWVVTTQDRDTIVQALHQDIRKWRDDQEVAPTIEYAGRIWDADKAAQERINSVILIGTAPPFWTDANNEDVEVTIDDLRGLAGAILLRGTQAHIRQRQMKQEIASLSVEELMVYQVG